MIVCDVDSAECFWHTSSCNTLFVSRGHESDVIITCTTSDLFAFVLVVFDLLCFAFGSRSDVLLESEEKALHGSLYAALFALLTELYITSWLDRLTCKAAYSIAETTFRLLIPGWGCLRSSLVCMACKTGVYSTRRWYAIRVCELDALRTKAAISIESSLESSFSASYLTVVMVFEIKEFQYECCSVSYTSLAFVVYLLLL